jgi:rod shape-determining protein MreC
MRSLLRFIVRFHFVLIFLLIESFSLFLLVRYNHYQRSTVVNSANRFSGKIYDNFSIVTDYFSLRRANLELANQNSNLLNRSKDAYKSNQVKLVEILDSLYFQQYEYRIAKVVNNSIVKQRNYLTLNKGSKHGIKPEMAVLGPTGIVGVVQQVSENYSSVISVLNSNLRVSGMLKNNKYFGSIQWDGRHYRHVMLREIPNHVEIEVGDTVITSGFSALFPSGVFIGTVSSVDEKQSGNFHNISVLLAEDFKNLSYVFVIGNLLKKEQKELEKIEN